MGIASHNASATSGRALQHAGPSGWPTIGSDDKMEVALIWINDIIYGVQIASTELGPRDRPIDKEAYRMDQSVTRQRTSSMSPVKCPPITAVGRGGADILLERADDDHWIVTMLSRTALEWATSELCCPLRACFAGSMKLDILSTNRLLKQANSQGFRTEFIGLGGRDVF